MTAPNESLPMYFPPAPFNLEDAVMCSALWQTHETNLTAMKLYDRIAERSGFIVYRKQI